jgi:imidazole glycerol-phosphate synthase subunit HisF
MISIMERKMHGGALKPLFQMAREHRNNSTPAEEILWSYLKTKPLGIKFRRQHPYSVYILDFYCHSLKLVIEVDGSIHNLEEVKNNDIERQGLLEKDGLRVLRFTNNELIHAYEKVIEDLNILIQKMIDDKKR